jgi:hypothetical protein
VLVPFCREGEDPGIPGPAERGPFSVCILRCKKGHTWTETNTIFLTLIATPASSIPPASLRG